MVQALCLCIEVIYSIYERVSILVIHVVKRGESIYTISRLYGVSPNKIISDNELTNPNSLVVGQTLVILGGQQKHLVAPGQTLYVIARNYGVSVSDLLRANPQITNPALLQPGQIINVPIDGVKLGTIDVNGYAFPNINREVLRKTLPHLTYLSIFSHEVRPDGSLGNVDDAALISAARAARVAPLMVISNIQEGGSFNSDLARTILTNNQVQDTLLNNVIQRMRERNYYGLDIDFEYIYPENREDYTRFLRKTVDRLRPLGYTVTTALAPKTSAQQQGLLYEAHDYRVHGELVDHVILMTYEWGFTYGPPKAVAPYNEVRKVLDYAVTVIPREKILMGIPNYGYDWTLPYVQGSAAKTVSNTGAVELAEREHAAIEYDTTARSPHFTYYDDNRKEHVVWFEDARSINSKLRLVNEYGLAGVSYWTIGRYFPQNWLVLNSLYNVRKVI